MADGTGPGNGFARNQGQFTSWAGDAALVDRFCAKFMTTREF
jgi:hypothetical protein